MFHAIRATLPIICSVFLAAAMVPQTSFGIAAVNSNNHLPSSGLAANQAADTPSSGEGSRIPQAESRCQFKPSESSYLAQARPTILCQRWLRPYILLHRVQETSGVCFDEIVDTRTGSILSRQPAPCNRDCGNDR
jgi:hypothetical protein